MLAASFRLARAIAALAVALAFAESALAAADLTLSVSPSQGVVGRPIEVLVRTYVPIRAGDLSLPVPSLAYPVASGLWDVLYPLPDLPLAIETRSPGGASTTIDLSRDPSDASLWRASFNPDEPGEWTIAVRNSPAMTPTRVLVLAAEAPPSTALVGGAALVAGLVIGTFLSRVRKRRRP